MTGVITGDAVAPLGRIGLVGCGSMGGAMLHRWIAAGLAADAIVVVDRGAPTVPAGVRLVSSLDAAGPIETLVLAVKPQQLDSLLAPPLPGPPPRLAISILAGVETATLAQKLAVASVVRAMPNLPVAIGKGVVALFAADDVDRQARVAVEALMRPLGLVEWIADEDRFDAVTALAGCGPGFVFRFAEALASAGAALGLDPGQALRLALATLDGAATMAMQASEPPAVLADRVASPGGSTREGLNVLDRDHVLERLMTKTVRAAEARNRAMAVAARG